MTILQILTRRKKKYENLANFDNETEKSMKIWLVRFRKVLPDFHTFSVYEGFFILTKISYLGGGGVEACFTKFSYLPEFHTFSV